MGLAIIGFGLLTLVMAEFTIPVQPMPLYRVPSRPIDSLEGSLWSRLLRLTAKAGNDIDRAGLLLQNIYLTFSFASQNAVFLSAMNPEDERKYYELKESHRALVEAIRGVEDKKYGIRINGHDLDILEPSNDLSGLVIPVAVGVVVLAAAIATAIWQSKLATEIALKYRELLLRTDNTLCSDPTSKLCQKWKAEKKTSGYEKNMSLADTLKTGVSKIAGGLSTGLLIAIPIVAFLALRRK